jgi:hypothetical protein
MDERYNQIKKEKIKIIDKMKIAVQINDDETYDRLFDELKLLEKEAREIYKKFMNRE